MTDDRLWKDYITFHRERDYPPSILRMMASIGEALEDVHGKGEAIVTSDYSGFVLRIRETPDEAASRVEAALKSAQNSVIWKEKAEQKRIEQAEKLGVPLEQLEEVLG